MVRILLSFTTNHRLWVLLVDWQSGTEMTDNFYLGRGLQMSDFERYPDLARLALGLPPWVIHLRTLNNLNTAAAILLAVAVSFSTSIGSGFAYLAIFIVGRFLIGGVSSTLAQSSSVLASIVIGTLAQVLLNVALALHYFGV